MKKGRFSAFPPIPSFGACSVGRLFAFSHIESHFRPLGWDASESVPHKPCFSVIYVGRCLHFSHRNGQNRGLMWDFAFSGLRRRAAAMRERRPAPRCARYDRYDGLTHPCRACCSAYSRYGVHESLHFLISRRASAPLHPLDGRETAIPPSEQTRSAKRRRCGMQFPRRTRTAKPKAEVCGHACLAVPGK